MIIEFLEILWISVSMFVVFLIVPLFLPKYTGLFQVLSGVLPIFMMWGEAHYEWSWNGWLALLFALATILPTLFLTMLLLELAGVFIAGLFGKSFSFLQFLSEGHEYSKQRGEEIREQEACEAAVAPKEKKGGLMNTALKIGAGYGIAKLTEKKTYAYSCRECGHYEERTGNTSGGKCPGCGKFSLHSKSI
ncbi:MAG: hypothetical protein ACR2PR_12850 [Pseudohongiellaceae bacterium]